jgi:hypothetical protein
MLYQQLYHLGAYPMGQGTSSLQPSTDNGTTEQLTAAHVDVSNAHYFPYQSAHAQGWASYPSPPFYQACWSCRQPHGDSPFLFMPLGMYDVCALHQFRYVLNHCMPYIANSQ